MLDPMPRKDLTLPPTAECQARIAAARNTALDDAVQLALVDSEALYRTTRSYLPPRNHVNDALYHMHLGGAQACEVLAVKLRKLMT